MSQRWQFAAWSFHTQSHVLETGEFSTTLEPRVARLLSFFLEHNGEVLSHDDLVSGVWDGRVISDEAVRRAVSQLRHALSRDGSDRFLKTVRKQGYLPQFPIASPAPVRRRRWPLLNRGLYALAGLSLLVVAVWLSGPYYGTGFGRAPLAAPAKVRVESQSMAQREYLAARALIGTYSHADLERAMQHLRNAIVLDPEFAPAYTLLAEALLTRANDNDREDYGATLAAAGPLVERALALDGSLADAWVLRATLVLDSDPAQAEADLRHAMRLNPGDSQPWERLAGHLMAFDEREAEVAALIDHAIALEPTRPRNYHLKTYLMLRQCDFAAAEALSRRALKVEPAFRASLVLLGRLAGGRGELAEALRLHEQAYALDPRSDWIRQTLHQSWLNIGVPEGALALGMSDQPAARWRELLYGGDVRAAAAVIEQADSYQLRHVKGWQVIESLRLAAQLDERERERWRAVLARHWDFVGELPQQPRREEIPLLMSALQLWHGPVLSPQREASLRGLYDRLLAEHRRRPRCHPAGEPLALLMAALSLGEREEALAQFRAVLRSPVEQVGWHWLLRSDPRLRALSREPVLLGAVEEFRARLRQEQARLRELTASGQVPDRASPRVVRVVGSSS